MKAVLLAGGLGTRISEETNLKPKPMVEVGGKPIVWHIMKIYSTYGINEFIICLGYKGYCIKEYFANYFLHTSDVTFDFSDHNRIDIHQNTSEPWKVTLVDTGDDTMTGGRLKRVAPYLNGEDFCFTYGDGVGDVNIRDVIKQHKESDSLATLTAAQPPGRFGSLTTEKNKVLGFQEKPVGDGGWVNAGFFVLSPEIFNYIDGDNIAWEKEPLERLANDHKLSAYYHHGFWQPMDTLRDKNYLEELWVTGAAPWKVWA